MKTFTKMILKTYCLYTFIVYCAFVVVFAPYYSYEYIKEHGFMAWLLFGEIVACWKALVWPYYVFFSG